MLVTTLISVGPKTEWGQWLDPMYVELLTDDGIKVRVFTEVRFIDIDQSKYTIPDGFISDGASIPKKAWSIVGGPLSGKYRRAAVLHDYLLSIGTIPDIAHMIFYRAMRADGCTVEQADLFYHAVVAHQWWGRLGALRSFVRSAWGVLKFIPKLVGR